MLRRLPRIALALPPMLASCVAPPVQGPSPRPAPVTVAPPPPVAPPPSAVPGAVEPGSWSYARTATGSSARFGSDGTVTFAIDCDSARKGIILRVLRINPPAPATTAVLRATNTSRTLPVADGGAFGTIQLAARDPILDALAFSRGKFGVAIDGRERSLPSWPEFTRVVEDCRA
jgi:hypothetical protein